MNRISNRISDRVISKLEQHKKRRHERAALAFATTYMKENRLDILVQAANEASGSTGCSHYDYAALHSIVRKKKPKFFLECGTGKSTWVIADALRRNHEQYGVEGIVVSMESVEQWHEQALAIFPPNLLPYARIVYSPETTFQHAMIRGTSYAELPDYPYEIVFIDGPAPGVVDNDVVNDSANMDFIRLLSRTDREMTAIIDYRVRTVMAYGLLLGKDRVKFLKPWNLGIAENVSRKHLLNNDTDFQPLLDRIKATTRFGYDFPEWLA